MLFFPSPASDPRSLSEPAVGRLRPRPVTGALTAAPPSPGFRGKANPPQNPPFFFFFSHPAAILTRSQRATGLCLRLLPLPSAPAVLPGISPYLPVISAAAKFSPAEGFSLGNLLLKPKSVPRVSSPAKIHPPPHSRGRPWPGCEAVFEDPSVICGEIGDRGFHSPLPFLLFLGFRLCKTHKRSCAPHSVPPNPNLLPHNPRGPKQDPELSRGRSPRSAHPGKRRPQKPGPGGSPQRPPLVKRARGVH